MLGGSAKKNTPKAGALHQRYQSKPQSKPQRAPQRYVLPSGYGIHDPFSSMITCELFTTVKNLFLDWLKGLPIQNGFPQATLKGPEGSQCVRSSGAHTLWLALSTWYKLNL